MSCANELVERIRQGPRDLRLNRTVQFGQPEQRPDSLPIFDDFLRALQEENTTIARVYCTKEWTRGLTDRQWSRTIEAFGRLPCLTEFIMDYVRVIDLSDYKSIPLRALTNMLCSSASLETLRMWEWRIISPATESAMEAFGTAVSQSKLRAYTCRCPIFEDQGPPSQDAIVRGLANCSTITHVHLVTDTNPVSLEALQSLIRSKSLTKLCLHTREWGDVADALQNNNLKVLKLCSWMSVDQIKVCQLAASIEKDNSLEYVCLESSNLLSVETGNVLARALKANRTLQQVELREHAKRLSLKTSAAARRACRALAEMLQVNHCLKLVVVAPKCVESSDEYKELEIQSLLNRLGRGRLLKTEASRASWVQALICAKQPKLNPDHVLDCLFSLVKLNPLLCQRESWKSAGASFDML